MKFWDESCTKIIIIIILLYIICYLHHLCLSKTVQNKSNSTSNKSTRNFEVHGVMVHAAHPGSLYSQTMVLLCSLNFINYLGEMVLYLARLRLY